MGHLVGKELYRKLGRKIDGLAARAPWNDTLYAILRELYTAEEAELVVRMPYGLADITPHFDQWIKALSAHRSQFLNPEKSRDYIDSLTLMARSFGMQARCKYGQGFYAVEPIVVGDIMSLAVSDRH